MQSAVVDIHGIGAFIKSNESEFIDFVKRNLAHYKSEKTKIKIEAELEYLKYSPLRVHKKLAAAKDFDCVGKGIFIGENEAYVDWGRLQIHILIDEANEKIKIYAKFCEDRLFFLMNSLMPSLTVRKHEFQGLMRYLLLFPVFWILEKKGFFLMHASGVEKSRKAMVFAGLPGAGKTTTAISLVLNKDFKFLSDNFLLCNQGRAYPLVEMVRIPKEQRFNLKKKLDEKGKVQLCLNKRFYYNFNRENISEGAALGKVFILKFSKNSSIKKIPNSECAGLLKSINTITPEIYDYYSYSYILSRAVNYIQKAPEFDEFLNGAECFLLSIDKKDSIENIYKMLL